MSRLPLVSIVVPAKNEEAALGATLAALPVETLLAAGFASEVLVLDGHSTDATVRIAQEWGATVVQDRGRGKGAAVREARHAVRGDYAVMVDADGTYAADAIPRVLAPLASNEADIVMGNRRRQAGAMTRVHRLGNVALSLSASLLYGRRCPDLCTGLWGFRTEAWKALPMRSTGFELEAEMFSLASRLRFRIAHTPVDYLPRLGTPKLNAMDGFRIGWCLVRSRFLGLPDRPSGLLAAPAPVVTTPPTRDSTGAKP